MAIVRSQRSVSEFYLQALASGDGTAERLDAPVSDRFAAFANAIEPRTPRMALDLGYGMGIYAVTLARLGFGVVAVDQIPADILRSRLTGHPDLADRIEIVEQRIENFSVERQFGVVVARDVLHYLQRHHVREVLTRCVQRAPAGASHYLEVFTDIERTDRRGRRVLIENEAAYTAADFRHTIETIYRDWTVHMTLTAHSENNTGPTATDPDRPRKYFSANRITVTARRAAITGGDPA